MQVLYACEVGNLRPCRVDGEGVILAVSDLHVCTILDCAAENSTVDGRAVQIHGVPVRHGGICRCRVAVAADDIAADGHIAKRYRIAFHLARTVRSAAINEAADAAARDGDGVSRDFCRTRRAVRIAADEVVEHRPL